MSTEQSQPAHQARQMDTHADIHTGRTQNIHMSCKNTQTHSQVELEASVDSYRHTGTHANMYTHTLERPYAIILVLQSVHTGCTHIQASNEQGPHSERI